MAKTAFERFGEQYERDLKDALGDLEAVITTLTLLQADNRAVVDYRITGAEEAAQRASDLIEHLLQGTHEEAG